jgi:hypothetical protein
MLGALFKPMAAINPVIPRGIEVSDCHAARARRDPRTCTSGVAPGKCFVAVKCPPGARIQIFGMGLSVFADYTKMLRIEAHILAPRTH